MPQTTSGLLSLKLIGESTLSFSQAKIPAFIFHSPPPVLLHPLMALFSEFTRLPAFRQAPILLWWLLNLSSSSACAWPTFLTRVYFKLRHQSAAFKTHQMMIHFSVQEPHMASLPDPASDASYWLHQAGEPPHIPSGHCDSSHEGDVFFSQMFALDVSSPEWDSPRHLHGQLISSRSWLLYHFRTLF